MNYDPKTKISKLLNALHITCNFDTLNKINILNNLK